MVSSSISPLSYNLTTTSGSFTMSDFINSFCRDFNTSGATTGSFTVVCFFTSGTLATELSTILGAGSFLIVLVLDLFGLVLGVVFFVTGGLTGFDWLFFVTGGLILGGLASRRKGST